MGVKNLKHYSTLSKKQAMANKYLKDAYERLGDHRAYNAAIDRINMFQKKHGQKVSSKLTLRNLTDNDTKKYAQILDSILQSTYLNPKKYEEYKRKQYGIAISEGWANDEKQAKEIFDFTNSELIDELKDIGLRDMPSKIVEKYAKYVQEKLSKGEFVSMSELFLSLYEENIVDYSDFFQFADDYKDFSAINERQNEYGIIQSNAEFFGSLVRSGYLTSPDISKAIYEYNEEPQFNEEGDLLSFIEYFEEYYANNIV